MGSTERLVMCTRNDILRKIRLNNKTKNKQPIVLKIIFSSTAVMEKPIGETETIGEESLPVVIKKPKKRRKKRETQSPAQLETLKRGREKLAQKRAKQRDEKKQEPMDVMIKTFEKRCTKMLHNLEQRVHK